MPRWCWRWRREIGRPCSPIYLGMKHEEKEFLPSKPSTGTVYLSFPELEAMRLVDLEGLTQEEASDSMKVSRGTVWRLLESGRRKIVEALIKNKKIVITEEKI